MIVNSGEFVHGVRGPRTAHAGARWVRTTALLTRLRSSGAPAAERNHQAASEIFVRPLRTGLDFELGDEPEQMSRIHALLLGRSQAELVLVERILSELLAGLERCRQG